MKKLVIAAAVLGAFAGTAQAQSSVTLFGVVDTNVTHINASGSESGSRTFEDNSGINSSRIGVRGTEDLGGGLKAGFWLEAGINTNNGSGGTTSTGNGAASGSALTGGGGLTFNRRSTVSLIGDKWGEVRVGRDYVPTFWNAANVDPFGYNGIAEIPDLFVGKGATGATQARASNGVSYLTPSTLGGFFVQATYAIGGNASNQNAPGISNNDGDYAGINVGYQNGPIYIGGASGYTHQAQTVEAGDTHVANLGASYDFGFVKPDFFYQSATINLAPEQITTNVASIGAVVPVGQGEFRFNYAHASGKDLLDGSHANLFGLGYVYNLSKRTALYGIYARINNSGDYNFALTQYTESTVPAIGQSTSGVSIGLRTSF
jgi:predicted porin